MFPYNQNLSSKAKAISNKLVVNNGDFDLPKLICLNGLFWYSFDKVRHW
jgi:hypothetical protein